MRTKLATAQRRRNVVFVGGILPIVDIYLFKATLHGITRRNVGFQDNKYTTLTSL